MLEKRFAADHRYTAMKLQRSSLRGASRCGQFRPALRIRAEAAVQASKEELLRGLDDACLALKKAPPSMVSRLAPQPLD